MALSKKTIIAVSVAAAAVVLGAGLTIGTSIYFDQQAQAEFDLANEEGTAEQKRHERALAARDAATLDAAAVHSRATALFDVTDDAMIADAGTKASLGTAVLKLAEIVPDAAESKPHDEAASDDTSAGSAGSTDDASAERGAGQHVSVSDKPDSREELHSAAAEMRAAQVTLRAQTLLLSQQTERIHEATEMVQAKAQQVLASAHAKATETEIPELASEESREALVAAIAALDQPATDADFAALMKSYLDSWAAVVASNDKARQNLDPASIEPTYIRGILVVNKTYALPSWYGDGLTSETVSAFDQMQTEAATHGLNIYISSGFRSYWSQESIYNRYVAADGRAEADRYSARPGHSEHQSGLTFDLNTIDEAFAYTPEGEWVRDNAHRFGFVIRYPQGKEHITGYIWEPWHLRYLGVEVATELYHSGLSLEEYLGITSQYAD